MKKGYVTLIALATLLSGVALGSLLPTARSIFPDNKQNLSDTTAQELPQVETMPIDVPKTQEPIDDPCREYLEDRPFRAMFNGTRLPLDHKTRFEWSYADAQVDPLSTGQMLVAVGDALYLLDQGKQVRWKITVPQSVIDYAPIESRGLIYVTSGDNNMFILELESGREIYSNGRNGSAAYGQVEPYLEDQCLILDNYCGYRMKMSESELNNPNWWTPEIMNDGITAWRGTEELWHRDFPPDAELLVKGDKIYAVAKTRTSVYTREIEVPKKGIRQMLKTDT